MTPPSLTRPLMGLCPVLGLVFAGLTPGVAWAACPDPVPARELAQTVSNGDAAYAEMDEDGFRSSRAAAAAMLPCVGESVSATHAAALHRLEALSAFLDRDHAGTVASFRALLHAAPGYRLPEDLAPPNHPLRIDFEVAEGTVGAPERSLPRPRQGWNQVDGQTAQSAPTDRPFVFQHFDGDGQVVSTALVPPGGALPDYGAKTGGSTARSGSRVPLLVTAGAATVLSGVFYGVAKSSESRFWDPATPQEDLQSLRGRTNAFGWLSAGAGLTAVGTGAGAFLSGRW